MKIKTRKPTAILFLFLFVVNIILFFAVHTSADPLDGFTATPLTNVPNEFHESPAISIWQQNIHIVWNTQNFENSTIFYKKSLDNGKTWANTTEIISSMNHAYSPVISVHENIVHVVWTDYRDNNSEIYYIRSIDNGNTWDVAQRLTFYSPIKNSIYDIVIVTDNENVYLAWKDYRTGTSEIFFKKSNDGGTTWTADQKLTSDYTPSYCPSLVLDGNSLYIAYQDGGLKPDICFLKSNSSGNEWTDKTYIVQTQNSSKSPCLAISGNILYLVWQDDRTGVEEIYFKKSNDHGETWGETQQLSSNSITCINPKIYAYNGNIVVIWQDLINKKFCISYSTSNDSGNTWTECKQLTIENDGYSLGITGEEDNIHIVYQKYYNGNWADIWHMGNQSIITKPITPEPSGFDVKNETPGFEFTILILTLLIIYTIKIISQKKVK